MCCRTVAPSTGGNDTNRQQFQQAAAMPQTQPPVAEPSNAASVPSGSQTVFQQQRQPPQVVQVGLHHQREQSSQVPQSFTTPLGSAPPPVTVLPQQQPHGTVSAVHDTPVVQFGQPGTGYLPAVPLELLYDPTQPAQASEHRIYTLGPVTLDQDEFAASIVSQQMGVDLPEQHQARLYVEPISFTETFFGTGGYPRLRETARPPGLRRKQACVFARAGAMQRSDRVCAAFRQVTAAIAQTCAPGADLCAVIFASCPALCSTCIDGPTAPTHSLAHPVQCSTNFCCL